jgi:hypothetical protein
MKRLLFLALLVYSCTTVSGQTAASNRYSYYIEIKDAAAKSKIESFSGLIKSQPGVLLFNHYRAARPFFVLVSGTPVSKKVFSDWITPSDLTLVRFEAKEITADFIRARRLEKKPGQKADIPGSRKN